MPKRKAIVPLSVKVMGIFLISSMMASPLSAAPVNTVVISTFDTGLEGWSLVYVAEDTGYLSYSATAGNPPGAAVFTDGGGGTNGTIRAPSSFSGDWSLVESLQYDHRILRLGGDPEIESIFDVWISGPGGSVRFRTDPM